jgi:hypothetical protein
MNFWIEAVQNSNLEALFVKAINKMAANEPGSASDENAHN